jgi:hypothetical protein
MSGEAGPSVLADKCPFLLPADGGGIFLDKPRKRVLR